MEKNEPSPHVTVNPKVFISLVDTSGTLFNLEISYETAKILRDKISAFISPILFGNQRV